MADVEQRAQKRSQEVRYVVVTEKEHFGSDHELKNCLFKTSRRTPRLPRRVEQQQNS